MSKVFSCSSCGPSKESISHIQFKNKKNENIIRIVKFENDDLVVKFSTDSNIFDDEFIEEFLCSNCGAPSLITTIADFLYSMGKVKRNIINE